MTEWHQGDKITKRTEDEDLGGTMRLGAYECQIKPKTLAHKAYGSDKIRERHRHRYEFNISYKEKFEKAGLVFSGMSPDGLLAEIVETKEHPWFIGVQFHPELKSRAFSPHQLFTSFIKTAINRR
jgi:CTP synthase